MHSLLLVSIADIITSNFIALLTRLHRMNSFTFSVIFMYPPLQNPRSEEGTHNTDLSIFKNLIHSYISAGYGEWVLYMMHLLRHLPLNVFGSFDKIWQIDDAVIRLLLNMRQGTTVLVLSQARSRPRAWRRQQAVRYNTHNPVNVEWTEFIFLAKLKRLKRIIKNYDFIQSTTFKKTFYGKPVPDSKQLRNTSKILDLLKNKPSNSIEKTSKSPLVGSSTLWFWDSSLPFVMSAINDCETLYKHDPITITSMRYITKFANHLREIATLEKINGTRKKYFSKLEESDTLSGEYYIPQAANKLIEENDISASKSKASFFLLHASELLKRKLNQSSPELVNSTIISAEEYFDHFASVYSLPDLNCFDFNHAGTATERIEVTQVFNFICNKHLKLTNDYCCAASS